MSAVVDTDVFSFFFKNDTRKVFYEPYLRDRFLLLSFMTYAELWQWSVGRSWGQAKKLRLESALRHYSIQYSNKEICEFWALVSNESKLMGKQLGPSDAWVAATALYLDVPLITHNAKDFNHIQHLSLITEKL